MRLQEKIAVQHRRAPVIRNHGAPHEVCFPCDGGAELPYPQIVKLRLAELSAEKGVQEDI